ncbi:TB2/DP1, HVA22 family-domain-containing protein [Polychytrium aggregatum]|uniref:TB2/DP1, HVA22 family-domain-containing protein n=1 Tax=Polychytrium aggregatum TaxID=110093 RepID=UPI0022FEECB9|nr:TB2/DP1, HVA22 family-domain-containing protein [Polychytrium aggregatum]KAI9202054.1 TB2/DP1, HVA22 family-domain-containing protein [Polychytrium aggregatum]
MANIPEQFQVYLKKFDNELSKIPLAVEAEKTLKVPKTYLAGGAIVVFFVLVFFNVWGELLTDLLGFLYPAYASFKALESPGKSDDKQWLTYWIVFGLVNTVEFFTDYILYWLPFYFFFKAFLVIYLIAPHFRGAEVLYVKFIKPVLLKEQSAIDGAISKAQTKIEETAAKVAVASENLKQD